MEISPRWDPTGSVRRPPRRLGRNSARTASKLISAVLVRVTVVYSELNKEKAVDIAKQLE